MMHRVLSLVLLVAATAGAQTKPKTPAKTPAKPAPKSAGISGVVRDTLESPIAGAGIFADDNKVSAISDDSGHFDLRGLAPGANGFTVIRRGYAPVSFETTLPPDSVITLAIHLRSVGALDSAKVKAVRLDAYLGTIGFTARRRMAQGSFLTPEQIDSLAPTVTSTSQLLRGLRGIVLDCKGAKCDAHTQEAPDCLSLFVDGRYLGAEQIDLLGLAPADVAAVEVYDQPSIVSTDLLKTIPRARGGGFSPALGCGAIAVWTKARVP